MKNITLQRNFLDGYDDGPSASDLLDLAHDKVTDWRRQKKVKLDTDSDIHRAVIALAVTFSPQFYRAVEKAKVDEDDTRILFLEVMGDPRQVAQETLVRSYRKYRNG